MSSRPDGASPPPATEPIFEVFCSRHFTGWLAEARLSLCFTTYQGGKGRVGSKSSPTASPAV